MVWFSYCVFKFLIYRNLWLIFNNVLYDIIIIMYLDYVSCLKLMVFFDVINDYGNVLFVLY